jgi:hypothetical protein
VTPASLNKPHINEYLGESEDSAENIDKNSEINVFYVNIVLVVSHFPAYLKFAQRQDRLI